MRPADFEKFINDQGYVRAPNFAKTQKATQKAAKRGDPAAQLALGTLCLLGYGVPQNLAAAAHWFEKAANQGDRDAQFILGELYWGGEGVLRDHDQAVKWFRRAAAQGDLQAHRVLAILGVASDNQEQDPQVSTGIHKQNRVIPIGRHPQHNPCKNDFAFAPDLFSIDPLVHANTYRDQMRPAALQPFEPDESYTIAFNFAKLRKAIRHAAKRGDFVAQSTLGTDYLCGYGVTQNLVVAHKWLEKAANQGECNAQFFLGEMYRDGEGVQPDDEEAAKWFRLAAAQGDVQAQQELAILCSQRDSLKRLDLTVTSSDPRHRRAVASLPQN